MFRPLHVSVMVIDAGALQLTSYIISTDPKISIIPGFLSDKECDDLITLSESVGFTRSLVGRGKYAEHDEDKSSTFQNQYSDNRTSSSVNVSRSLNETLITPIEQRLAALVKMPENHLEDLIVVKYEPGQFFGTHHDGNFRPYTVFLYLNDLPGGGETRFPELRIRVRPRKGAALVWANTVTTVHEDGTSSTTGDMRLVHEALPPDDGCVKYGVNCFFNEHIMRKT